MLPMIEIHAPAVIQAPIETHKSIMVYDAKDILINATHATRAGVSSSDHHTQYTIWFDDGMKRHHMKRVFNSLEEATEFLESIYNIKE